MGRYVASAVRFRRRLLLITGLGAAWRIGYLLVAKSDQPLLLNDSLYFSLQASLNAEGRWFEDALTGQPGAEHGMLTALYLTPWSLGGDDVLRQRLAVTLLGIATVYVLGITGRRLASPLGEPVAGRVGLCAAGIAVISPNLWINDSLVMSETLAILLVTLGLYAALAHHIAPTVRTGAVLGVLTGLAALTRSELVLLVPGYAIVSAVVSRRRSRTWHPSLAIVLAASLTVLPWALANVVRFNEPVLLSTNDGTTLLGANCDLTYYDDVGGWDVRCLGPLSPGGVGHEVGAPDASQRSATRRDEAIEYVGEHLDRLPVVLLARVGRGLDIYGLGSMVDNDVGEEKARWAVWAGVIAWWTLAVAAAVGWSRLRQRAVGARWWLAVPLLTVLSTTIAFYGAHRIRAPAEPVVVLLAAVAVAVGRAGVGSGSTGGPRQRKRAGSAHQSDGRPPNIEVGAGTLVS